MRSKSSCLSYSSRFIGKNMANLSEALEALINKKQITQQDLAKRADLTPSYISHLILGSRNNPSAKALIKLANALELDYEDKKLLFDAAGVPLPFPSIVTAPPVPLTPMLIGKNTSENTNEDWGEAPNVQAFYGREEELEKLRNWILYEHCQLVTISGVGGIGKTMLVTRVAQDSASEFDYVFWRSLKDAPPIESILKQCLVLLSDQQQPYPHLSRDEQSQLLIHYLKTRRCLLILDNLESILQEQEHSGEYRETYEDYGKLLDAIGRTQHRSCLLLTTREIPKDVALQEGSSTPVRLFALKGLKADDGLKILTDKKLHWIGKEIEDARELIERYAGNPLALKVAAEYIRDVFSSNIRAFLNTESLILKNIKDILEQQFKRLSPLEREIMYWFTIEREAVAQDDLLDDLAHPLKRTELVEALQGLRRRDLIEQNEVKYSLLSVILEYMTEKLVTRAVEEIEGEFIDLLESHALMKAQSKDYIRETQNRLILDPVAQQLRADFGINGSEEKLKSILHKLHEASLDKPGYAAGNVLNLLIHMGYDLSGYDFSHLYVWQAYLQGVSLNQVNFSYANLARSVFTDTFSSILSVALSPDTRMFAAGTESGEVHVWDTNTGTPLRTYYGHSKRVRSVAFSPDGRTIVSGSEDYDLRVWSTTTEQCLFILTGHSDRVRAVAISPDSTSIISGSDDKTVRIWDLHTGQSLNTLEGHTDRVRAVAYSLDEKTIASAGEDETIRLWNAHSGELLRTLRGHEKHVHAVNFSKDGKWLVSGGEDQTVRIWDVESGACLKILRGHTNQVRSVAFHPHGDAIASSSDDTTIRLWDAYSGRCLKTIEGHLHRVYSVEYSIDGSIIISGSEDQTVRLWDAHFGQPLKTLQGYINQVRSVAFHPDGTLLVSGGDDQQLRLWNIQTGQYIRTLQGHTNGIRGVAFSPDGEKIASCSDDRTIRLWNAHTGKNLKVLQEHSNRVRTIAFSRDGGWLASGGEDLSVRIWDTKTGQRLKILHGHTDWVRSVAFHPDGLRLVSGGEDYTVRVWDIASGKCLHMLAGHQNGVRSVAFSPDGSLLTSSGDDETIRFWDTATWQQVKILEGDEQARLHWIISIAFSPDGTLLVSGGEDGVVRLWSLLHGKSLRTLSGHDNRVYSVAFHPDGRMLASGSLDGTIRLWDVETGVCLRTLRKNKPYEGMNITGIRGLTETQEAILKDLGAVEEE